MKPYLLLTPWTTYYLRDCKGNHDDRLVYMGEDL